MAECLSLGVSRGARRRASTLQRRHSRVQLSTCVRARVERPLARQSLTKSMDQRSLDRCGAVVPTALPPLSLLSARAAAFLLEPKRESDHIEDAATLLDLAAAAYQSRGTASGRTLRDRLLKYAGQLRRGKVSNIKVVIAAKPGAR